LKHEGLRDPAAASKTRDENKISATRTDQKRWPGDWATAEAKNRSRQWQHALLQTEDRDCSQAARTARMGAGTTILTGSLRFASRNTIGRRAD
jgi:hypothetical protein